MTVFGPVVYKHQVEDAVESTLKQWIETNLGEGDRNNDRDPDGDKKRVPPIRSWHRRAELEAWAGDRLPAVIIHASGARANGADEDDQVHADWTVEVAVFHLDKPEREAEEIVSIIAGEIKRLLPQHGSLGGIADETRFVGEDYPVLRRGGRLLEGAVVQFQVTTLRALRTRWDGPAEPLEPARDPYPDLVEVESVDIDVDPQPI